MWSGVIFVIMGLLMCLFFFIWRSRIPFAKEMLKYCIDTINQVRYLPRCIACANADLA